MLFAAPSVLIVLKRSSLEVYSGEEGLLSKLSFDTNFFDHLEVKDDVAFKTALENFLAKNDLKSPLFVIGVANDSVFEKELSPTEGNEKQKEIQTFKDMVPLEGQKIRGGELEVENRVKVFFTNGEVIDIVQSELLKHGWKVEAAIPLAASSQITSFSKNDALSHDEAKQVLSEAKEINKHLTFFHSSKSENQLETPEIKKEETLSEEVTSTEQTKPTQWRLLAVAGLLFLIAGGGILYATGIIKLPSIAPKTLTEELSPTDTNSGAIDEPLSAPQPQASVTPASTNSAATSSVVNQSLKQELVISILNGSGVAGQASILKSQLEKVGYREIQTGNTTVTGPTSTISFSQNVDPSIKAEIIQELKKTLPDLQEREVPDLSSSDVLVITAE